MGTYDTRGGSAASPDAQDETCDGCKRDASQCICEDKMPTPIAPVLTTTKILEIYRELYDDRNLAEWRVGSGGIRTGRYFYERGYAAAQSESQGVPREPTGPCPKCGISGKGRCYRDDCAFRDQWLGADMREMYAAPPATPDKVSGAEAARVASGVSPHWNAQTALEWIAARYSDRKTTDQCATDAYEMAGVARAALINIAAGIASPPAPAAERWKCLHLRSKWKVGGQSGTCWDCGASLPIGPPAAGSPAAGERCMCETCTPQGNPLTGGSMRFIACAICGNKRCPHATDHRNACTNSNEPGQPGSAFGPPTPDDGHSDAEFLLRTSIALLRDALLLLDTRTALWQRIADFIVDNKL